MPIGHYAKRRLSAIAKERAPEIAAERAAKAAEKEAAKSELSAERERLREERKLDPALPKHGFDWKQCVADNEAIKRRQARAEALRRMREMERLELARAAKAECQRILMTGLNGQPEDPQRLEAERRRIRGAMYTTRGGWR